MKRASLLAVCLAVACSSSGGGGDGGAGDGGVGPITPVDPGSGDVAPVEPDPTNPKDDAGGALGWSSAPELKGVLYRKNRDSVQLVLPAVDGAADYRVALVPKGVSVSADAKGESIKGTTIFCAGYKQRNAPKGARELLRQIEVTGLGAETRLVIEAIATPCPFGGVIGAQHADVNADTVEVPVADRVKFSVYTEAEVSARFGSVIVNGHGPGATLASQGDPTPPKVLARTAVKVQTLGTSTTPPGVTFFDDFAANDAPAFVSNVTDDGGRSQQGKLLRNQSWSFYTFGAEHAQFFPWRGQLGMVLADWGQEIMSTTFMIPKKPVALSASDYLHVTYEVATDATARRYWWFFLCGADQAGATMDASGTLKKNVVQTPFFMNDDGLNPSLGSWNCLQIFPRDGWPFPLPPNDARPETEVRVMVNAANKPGRDSVVDVSPAMYDKDTGPPSWYRQRDGKGTLVAPMLDDQQLVSPRTRYDLFIKRDRVVMYVNGQQRLCNDFPTVALTMAEGVPGFGQVFYHSAAERVEFSVDYWDRTGQRYYLENTPYVDARQWDNVGWGEHVGLPGGIVSAFDESACYRHQ